jgi:flagellar basal body-associated protein FliL
VPLTPNIPKPSDTSAQQITKAMLAQAAAQQEQESFVHLRRELNSYARAHGFSNEVQAVIEERGLVVRVLTDKLLFSSGQAQQLGAVDRPSHDGGALPDRTRRGRPAPVGGRLRRPAPDRQQRYGLRPGAEPPRRHRRGPHLPRPEPLGLHMKKKLLIILVVVLAGGGYAAKTFLMPKPAVAKPKIAGTIYVLPKGFTFNLTDGRYATMTIGLILAPGQSDGATAAGTTTSPAGIGTLPEEPAIRAIITNIVTDQNSQALLSASGRSNLRQEILTQIKDSTDVKVTNILFTDVAVQ